MSDEDTVYARYARTWVFISVIALVLMGAGLVVAGPLLDADEKWSEGLRAVGESLIASVIVYLLISVMVDPKRQVADARSLTRYVVEESQRHFQDRFETSLPTAVHDPSMIPKRSFKDAFTDLLVGSRRYDYLGATGYFTAFRLHQIKHRQELGDLEQVRLCVLDPTDEVVMRAHADLRLRERDESPTASNVSLEVERLRDEIYLTVLALWRSGSYVPISIHFHRMLGFFRCEMFDRGMFLTYFVGRTRYPETLQFKSRTRPYRAYQGAMDQARMFASRVAVFGNYNPSADLVDSETKLVALLADLGNTRALPELEVAMDAKHGALLERLRQAGISPQEPF